jgi:hypothetical protein
LALFPAAAQRIGLADRDFSEWQERTVAGQINRFGIIGCPQYDIAPDDFFGFNIRTSSAFLLEVPPWRKFFLQAS